MSKNLNDLLYRSLGDNDIVHMISINSVNRIERIIIAELSSGEVVTIVYNFKAKEFRIEE